MYIKLKRQGSACSPMKLSLDGKGQTQIKRNIEKQMPNLCILRIELKL